MNNHNNRIKFVVIHSEALTQRWESYLHLDELAESFDVEFWDCSYIALPHYTSNGLKRPYVKTIEEVSHYKKELKALPLDTLIVLDRAMFRKENLAFMKILSKRFPKQVDIDFFSSNQLITSFWSVSTSTIEDLSMTKEVVEEKKQTIKLTSLFKSIKRWLYGSDVIYLTMKRIRYRNDKNGFRDVLKSFYSRKCDKLFLTYLISTVEGSTYPINPPDYEQYLKLGECKEEKEYIVFIDQAFPIHPEFRSLYTYLGIEALAEEYYKSTRKFFDTVEQQMGLKVIIAGHPVANYKGDEYGNREIVYGKTAELVRDAKAVIGHTSGAINFPIYYEKPLVLITNSAWKKAIRHMNHLLRVADYFKKPIVDIDKVVDITTYLKPVDPAIRREYMDSMIDKRTKGKLNADLLKEYLAQIHEEMYR